MNLRFMYISSSVKALIGYTPDEIMNLTIDKILTPASFKAALNKFEEEKAIDIARAEKTGYDYHGYNDARGN